MQMPERVLDAQRVGNPDIVAKRDKPESTLQPLGHLNSVYSLKFRVSHDVEYASTKMPWFLREAGHRMFGQSFPQC